MKIISAGAGSGKTYRLTQEMVALLKSGVRASGIIATTFTTKAAAELQERVRVKLLEEGLTDEANDLSNALIGTVHGLGVKLLKRFAFEAGVSPEVAIIADEDQQILFNKSLANVLTNERIKIMEGYGDRLGLNKRERYDWRLEVKNLTDVARTNDFSLEVLEKSRAKSFETFKTFLSPVSEQTKEYFIDKLSALLETTIAELEANEDTTKVTEVGKNTLKGFLQTIKLKNELNWHEWVKIAKLKVGAKSREAISELTDFAKQHDAHPDFHRDIEKFINGIFDLAIEAIKEYDLYKKQRGLIDYIDMEIHVKRLLDQPRIREILAEELDLLMVDEFQDTSPIQLEIFLKLSKIAKHSIWVGDPKQSIYGFRGADPQLMMEIIEANGGVKPEDIQEHSWRSREDIVHLTNALFTKAFTDIKDEQIVLKAKRTKLDNPDDARFPAEPLEMGDAIHHWHCNFAGEGRLPGKPWMENCIAEALKRMLERETFVIPKGATQQRRLRPGDVAILCRSNFECQTVADALHRAGLKAAISRSGLLSTAEAKLVLACMKFILHRSDSLSVAEILLLADDKNIEWIIENRLEFLQEQEQNPARKLWARESFYINRLNELREKVEELSSTEILNLIIEELDLRRIIVSWGNIQQRMDNIDELRKLALNYEEACNRLHTAASLGGLLLWLNELSTNDNDMQGSGESEDTVNVMTYHKSKGLEWPVVICHSLESKLRDKVWGINIVPKTDKIDLNNILGNRWLRYWINPYSDQQHHTPLLERINESPVKKQATKQALEEDARLLYVGITRARDYLVIPTRSQPTRWLNRIWHDGDETIPTLDATTSETPWEWKGQPILKETPDDLNFPRDFTYAEPPREEVRYFAENAGNEALIPYHIDLSKETFDEDYKIRIDHPMTYGAAIPIPEEANPYTAAKLFKAFFTADHLKYPEAERLEMAEQFIERYELEEWLEAPVLLNASASFYHFLKKQFSIKKVYRKYPVSLHYKKRLFRRIIDLILVTDEGIIIVQNSGFQGDPKAWQKKSGELGDFMFLSGLAVEKIFAKPISGAFIHYVLGGGMQGLVLQKTVQVV